MTRLACDRCRARNGDPGFGSGEFAFVGWVLLCPRCRDPRRIEMDYGPGLTETLLSWLQMKAYFDELDYQMRRRVLGA